MKTVYCLENCTFKTSEKPKDTSRFLLIMFVDLLCLFYWNRCIQSLQAARNWYTPNGKKELASKTLLLYDFPT